MSLYPGGPATGHDNRSVLGFTQSCKQMLRYFASYYCVLLMQPSRLKFVTFKTLCWEHEIHHRSELSNSLFTRKIKMSRPLSQAKTCNHSNVFSSILHLWKLRAVKSSYALKEDAIDSFETEQTNYYITRPHIPEHCNFHSTLKSTFLGMWIRVHRRFLSIYYLHLHSQRISQVTSKKKQVWYSRMHSLKEVSSCWLLDSVDGGRMLLRNAGKHLPNYTASHRRM
jgi:hypothetical protein